MLKKYCITEIFFVILQTVFIKKEIMARMCQITGKKAMTGNNVSHANNKTKRVFQVNLMDKKFFMTETNQWISLRVSAHGIRIINKIGIEEAVARSKRNGYIK